MGIWVQDSGFGVWDVGSGVLGWGWGFGVWGSEFGVWGAWALWVQPGMSLKGMRGQTGMLLELGGGY